MNKAKLHNAVDLFFAKYPGGFTHPEMVEIAKKHKVDKMNKMAQVGLRLEQFKDTDSVMETNGKIVHHWYPYL